MTRLEKNWLEWTVFALSAVLVSGILAYLFFDMATVTRTAPHIVVSLGASKTQQNHYLIPLIVRNHGVQTAQQIEIHVSLQKGGKEQEQARVLIDFLARGSSRNAWVGFKSDPYLADKIVARVISYQTPYGNSE